MVLFITSLAFLYLKFQRKDPALVALTVFDFIYSIFTICSNILQIALAEQYLHNNDTISGVFIIGIRFFEGCIACQIFQSYQFTEKEKYKTFGIGSFVAVASISFVDIQCIKYLPWSATEFSNQHDGFPTLSTFNLAHCIPLLGNFSVILISLLSPPNNRSILVAFISGACFLKILSSLIFKRFSQKNMLLSSTTVPVKDHELLAMKSNEVQYPHDFVSERVQNPIILDEISYL